MPITVALYSWFCLWANCPATRLILTSADWGSIPEWFGAFGTLLAVGVALVVSFRDGKRLDLERIEAAEDRRAFRQEREEERVETMYRHARQVVLLHFREGTSLPGDSPSLTEHHFEISNNGPDVIRDVFLNYAGDSKVDLISAWPVLSAGDTVTCVRPIKKSDSDDKDDYLLSFIDVYGRGWETTALGDVKLLAPGRPSATGFQK